MEQKIFHTASLEANVRQITDLFRNDFTVKQRRIRNDSCGREFAVFFVDAMVNSILINDHILEPLMTSRELDRPGDPLQIARDFVIPVNEQKDLPDLSELYSELLSGSAILLADGSSSALAFGVKNLPARSIQEPESEKVLKGPREGFTENIMVNLALIRKKVRTAELRYRFAQLGTRTGTRYALCYLDGIADPSLVSKLENKLKTIEIDGILDANYIQELIRDTKFSPFRTSGSTERPDVAAAKLLEGRILLVIDGTPAVITLPFFFLEYFQVNDDYYSHYLFGSFGRILRILGFLFTISFPAFYLAMVTYHQNLLPTRLVLNLAAARQDLPFSTFWEMLGLILAFELIREGGAHIPSGFGQTLSIVGGLVLGQASVDAKLVSIPVVIIVAFSGISGLITPQLKPAVVFFRFAFLFAAAAFGLPGLFLVYCLMVWHLSTLRTFDFPYLSSLSRHRSQFLQDTFLRSPWDRMRFRPNGIAPNNGVRQTQSVLRKSSFFLLCLFLLPVLCGCGSLEEINDRSILSAAAFDLSETENPQERFRISAEVIKDHTGADSGSPKTSVTEGTGASPFLAAEDLNFAVQKPISWAHCRLIALGEPLLREEGLDGILSLFLEQEEFFLSADLVVLQPSENQVFWQPDRKVNGTTLAEILTVSAKTTGTPICSAAQACHLLRSGDSDLLLPAAVLENDEYRITGSALLAEGRLRGFLNLQETFFLQLLRSEATEGTVILPDGRSFRIFNASVQTKQVYPELPQHRQYHLQIEGAFTNAERLTVLLGPSSGDTDPDALVVSAFLRRQCLSVFDRCRDEFGTFPLASGTGGFPVKTMDLTCDVVIVDPPSKGGLL